MRVIWKDSLSWKTYKYRGHIIERNQGGWITNVPGDEYVYYSADMAHNAVDKMLGGRTRKGNPGRHKVGIKVIGKKGEAERKAN